MKVGGVPLNRAHTVKHTSEGCEWNPVRMEPALADDPHYRSTKAAVQIGDGVYRVCGDCAMLPRFRNFKKFTLK